MHSAAFRIFGFAAEVGLLDKLPFLNVDSLILIMTAENFRRSVNFANTHGIST